MLYKDNKKRKKLKKKEEKKNKTLFLYHSMYSKYAKLYIIVSFFKKNMYAFFYKKILNLHNFFNK